MKIQFGEYSIVDNPLGFPFSRLDYILPNGTKRISICNVIYTKSEMVKMVIEMWKINT